MEEVTVTMEHDKTTKNTMRFKQIAHKDAPVIPTLYLPKWFVGTTTKIRVTVTPSS